MINPRYLVYHDLIGFYVLTKPLSKYNKSKFVDIGVVINETRNLLITELDNKIKKYIKKDYIFRFLLPHYKNEIEDYYLEVQGNKIVGLPVNRLRSLKKKRWFKR